MTGGSKMGTIKITKSHEFKKERDWSIEQEIELMHKLIYLSAEELVFFGCYNSEKKDWDDGVYPALMCNDFFHPAADAEDFTIDDVDLLIDLYQRFDYYGPMAWIGEKRGLNGPWRANRFDMEKYHQAVKYLRELKNAS